MLVDNSVDPDTDKVELINGLESTGPTKHTFSCVSALKNMWNWRINAKHQQEIESRDTIVASIDKLNSKIVTQEARQVEMHENIKKCVKTGNKPQARRILLQRKRTDNMLRSLYAYRDELESVLISLDESNEQLELVASFKSANKVLKSHAIGGNAIDDFDSVVDDLQEAQQDIAELQQAVTQRTENNQDGIDEELEELFTKSEDNTPGNPPPQNRSLSLKFPKAPSSLISSAALTPTLRKQRKEANIMLA